MTSGWDLAGMMTAKGLRHRNQPSGAVLILLHIMSFNIRDSRSSEEAYAESIRRLGRFNWAECAPITVRPLRKRNHNEKEKFKDQERVCNSSAIYLEWDLEEYNMNIEGRIADTTIPTLPHSSRPEVCVPIYSKVPIDMYMMHIHGNVHLDNRFLSTRWAWRDHREVPISMAVRHIHGDTGSTGVIQQIDW